MKSFARKILLWVGSVISCDNSPKTLFYHDIGLKYTRMGTDLELFFSHMNFLEKVNRGLERDDQHRVCFDDGFRGIWDYRDQLKRYGLSPIVFIAVRLVGCPGYLTWDEIRELEKNYGYEFQCHTWSHQTLAGPMIMESPVNERTDNWYYHELAESKLEIENQLGHPVSSLCFPVGYYNNDVLRRCQEVGYTQVYGSFPGNKNHTYLQARCLCQYLSLIEFKSVLRGGMNFLAKRYMRMHYFK